MQRDTARFTALVIARRDERKSVESVGILSMENYVGTYVIQWFSFYQIYPGNFTLRANYNAFNNIYTDRREPFFSVGNYYLCIYRIVRVTHPSVGRG